MRRPQIALSLRVLAWAASLLVVAGATSGCRAGIGVATYPEYDDYPPDAYIATTEPVYYEGRPAYWYGGRWFYRDGARWGRYDREPRVLYDRRMQAPPARRYYEGPRVQGHFSAGVRVGGHR